MATRRKVAGKPAGPRAAGRPTCRVESPPGFSLRETVLSHGWFDLAPFEWDDAGLTLYRSERLPNGTRHRFAIRQRAGKGTALRVRWLTESPASPDRKMLLTRIRRILNLDLDLSGFLALCRREPRLRYVPRAGAGRFLRCGNLYEEVFKAMCGTNIAWKQAVLAINRIAALGDPVDGSASRCFPHPERIIQCGDEKLRAISRLGYRVPYLLAWARRVTEGDPGLGPVESGGATEQESMQFLLSVKGVGKATARYLHMIWGHANEISIDSSVYLYCRRERFGGRTPSEREIQSLYEAYRPWKAYAYWFEFLPWARKHWGLSGKPDAMKLI